MLVMDFDGTCTDAEEEGKPFTQACLMDIAQQTGLDLDRVREIARDTEIAMRERPQEFAWVMNGFQVAPASVDPYLRMKPIVAAVHQELGVGDQIVDPLKLYKDNYPKSGTHLRVGLLHLMRRLMRTDRHAYIVTNSDTQAVRDKLRQLAMLLSDQGRRDAEEFQRFWRPRVHGLAKKYMVSPSRHRGIPHEDLHLPGLNRPVHVQRHEYFRVLERLRAQAEVPPEKVLVVGDIFELDLALPQALGMHVALFRTDLTPAYEVEYLLGHDNGHVISSVEEILPLYQKVQAA